MRALSVWLVTACLFSSCGSSAQLQTVEQVDLEKYSGTWYEIAKLPNRFQRGLDCVTAIYSLKDNGNVGVLNKGRQFAKGDRWKDASGYARVPDEAYPGRLKVTFFWPFAGDYYIIDLDPEYQVAMVGNPGRKYLWILARTPEIDDATYYTLMRKAFSLGFDTDAVERTNQSCFTE